ncbi:MAG: ribbon-helix-helix domain-containing protein [Candidatus Bathyarchaeota archaeon]|nr:ribbon-helix-helix domain-containing protein [Candidatus Bathyarchaeota archaeon]
MKTLRISDSLHRKLTATLGTLMAQTGKMQTYQDAIEAMLARSVILPTELLADIDKFIEESKHLGFTTREEFLRDATRWRMKLFMENTEYVEIPKVKYRKLDAALKEMDAPYLSASDFINKQIDEVLGKYDCRKKKKEHEQRQRK